MENISKDLLAKAYKKLKSNIYFDKTQLILRNKLVEFENNCNNLDEYFEDLCSRFISTEKYEDLKEEILNSVSFFAFPKKVKNNNSKEDEKDIIISNYYSEDIEIGEIQYFIDLGIEGHILGVLWLMLIGYRIDKEIYKYSYGNRIRKNLYNEFSDKPTFSPYLFEPYFAQYESWRDTAMDKALEQLKSNNDILIITMDFKRYYYSLDINKKIFDQLYNESSIDKEEGVNKILLNRLNEIIFLIVKKYSSLFKDGEFENRNILPIGFLPSQVIANWCLKNFDKTVIDGWNPIYFGRYVDDILIVDKIEHNSSIFDKAKNYSLNKNDVIKFLMKQCSKWNGFYLNECEEKNKYALIIEEDDNFVINKKYNPIPGDNSKIMLQSNKLKVFYFKSKDTYALIECFKEQISKNRSEFRHMPEDEAVFQKDDYNEIYTLKNSDTLNKFRGIEGIYIDKYELSKLLGKYLRIGGMIDDIKESKFERNIIKIFNEHTIIENYFLWEKVIEIFVINERFESVELFIGNIISAIDIIKFDSSETLSDIKKTLMLYLHSAICRSFSLVWKEECIKTIKAIYKNKNFLNAIYENKIFLKNKLHTSFLRAIKNKRIGYLKTRMVDKSVMPIIIDMLLDSEFWNNENNINLTKFYDVLPIVSENWTSSYKYYPFLITMHDFSMISCIKEFNSEKPFSEPDKIYKSQNENYVECNYDVFVNDYPEPIKVARTSLGENVYQISVGKAHKDRLKIAIANVRLYHKNFELLVKDSPNRSYKRYNDISRLVNHAIDENADMLIMPESFVPYEWLSTLARTCAKNNLAIVTGVEHVKFKYLNKNNISENKVFNLTAVILPYKEENYKCSYIYFHLKRHYAPLEKSEITGYRLIAVEGNTFELYKWNDCYFPVYCCYELASINDRALFQSYADFLVAIEWNRDINYYSNILESLSRDLHCYCVQVNSSDYGDSRITKPSKTEEKDIIRTKGGENSTILTGEIDIKRLREFQFKEYELQVKDKIFKTTPPHFNKEVILKKIKGIPLY